MFVKAAALALISVVLSTAGQLLLKTGMGRVGVISGARLGKPLRLILEVAKTWEVAVGMALFLCSAAFWLVLLSRAPLSFAYPFLGLGYVVIPLFGKFVLREHVPMVRWLGVALIIFGIIVVGYTSPPDVPADREATKAATSAAR